MSRGMNSFLETLGCLAIGCAILAMGWWGIQSDPDFDTTRAAKSPQNLGAAWVPENTDR